MSDVMRFQGNFDAKADFVVINKSMNMILFFDNIQEMKDSLAGDLDSDWKIFIRTTYSKELEKNSIGEESKRAMPNSNKRRLRELGI